MLTLNRYAKDKRLENQMI